MDPLDRLAMCKQSLEQLAQAARLIGLPELGNTLQDISLEIYVATRQLESQNDGDETPLGDVVLEALAELGGQK